MKNLKIIFVAITISLISSVCFSQTQIIKEEKTEVQVSDLPETVTKTLTEIYPDYEIVKAYNTTLDSKKVYSISLLDQEKKTEVYVDTQGNLIENTLEDDNDKK